MQTKLDGTNSPLISVLVVDDSLVFRRFLRDIFEESGDMVIVGEARNGIEALDLLLKTSPDVILLDMEMPLMDGMTALQHLMIHLPKPVMMFSSLTPEGTARCYDAMKNGAVDFICKDFIFQEEQKDIHRQLVLDKVRRAAGVTINSREPVFTGGESARVSLEKEQRIIFCEECGNKEFVAFTGSQYAESVVCSSCGDLIEFAAALHYRRSTSVTVIGGGRGSFQNLLQIVPLLEAGMEGALIVVIHMPPGHVDAFAEYLDAISPMDILRVREGVSIEGGNCYLASGHDYMSIELRGTRSTLNRLVQVDPDTGPLDVLMASASSHYKKRTAAVILSGDSGDGEKGMNVLLGNGGTGLVLDPAFCLCKSMGEQIMTKCDLRPAGGFDAVIREVKRLQSSEKDDIAHQYESYV
ncbi:MAG: response regulator [Deltaproteobacteria bacterium]|nr:response regulator [Deltaproteobacteria bacterium]